VIRKLGILTIVGLFLMTSTTACIGRGALGGSVMKFNLEVTENKWGRWLVFLGLNIIMVYPIAGFIDLLIINSIEFHKGTNPWNGEPRLAEVGQPHRIEASDGTAAVSTLREDGSIDITIIRTDGSEHFINVQQTEGATQVRNSEGDDLGSITDDGHVRLTDLARAFAQE
jgi:hypothetical protein